MGNVILRLFWRLRQLALAWLKVSSSAMFNCPEAPEPGAQSTSPAKESDVSPALTAGLVTVMKAEPKDSPIKVDPETGNEVVLVEGSGEQPAPTPQSSLCEVCSKKAKAAKSRFCSVCRSDIVAAKRECDRSGPDRARWFQQLQKKGGEDFIDFMVSYVKENGLSRRRYSQRNSFDFARYEESRKVQSRFRLGYKAIFMHKERAVKHWIERQALTRAEALSKWSEEHATAEKSKHVLHDGPGGSDTIPVKYDNFLIVEDDLVHEKAAYKEHKRTRYTEDVGALMEEGLNSGRAFRSEDLEKFGVAHFDNAEMAENMFGARGLVEAPAMSAVVGGRAVESQSEEPAGVTKKVKAFDAATERIAAQTKLAQALDKCFNELQQQVADASQCIQETKADESNLPINEKEALRLLGARVAVAKTHKAQYKPGVLTYDQEAANSCQKIFETALKGRNPELPDMFNETYCFVKIANTLDEEVKALVDHDGKKRLEAAFKPALNVASLLKSAIKTATEKVRKFAKERALAADKLKRSEEVAARKQIAQDRISQEARSG